MGSVDPDQSDLRATLSADKSMKFFLTALYTLELHCPHMFLFFGFSVKLTPLGSYGAFQLLLVEEDPAHTNI